MLKKRRLTQGLFIFYLAALTWIILFKMEVSMELLSEMHLRSINLIPFGESLVINGKTDIGEILLNVAAFVPFGIYMGMLNQKKGFGGKLLPVVIVSLLFETFQYILAVGASDITDLITNTLGGILGIGVFRLFSGVLKDRAVLVMNGLAFAGTLAMSAFLGLLVLANL